jgi:hypothetical protein
MAPTRRHATLSHLAAQTQPPNRCVALPRTVTGGATTLMPSIKALIGGFSGLTVESDRYAATACP